MNVASVCVAGQPAQQDRSTRHRLELLQHIIDVITDTKGWAALDVVLFPAGFLRSREWYGPLTARARECLFRRADWGLACRAAAGSLEHTSPGVVLAVGVDTGKPNPYWRGDQMMVAFNHSGPIGWARKMFPFEGETDEVERAPYLLFERDFVDPKRLIRLPSGETAILSVCYDAFVFRELRRGPTSKRRALRFRGVGQDDWDPLPAQLRDVWLDRFDALIEANRPTLNLVGIHRFRRPGAEVLWQRHGISTASAALSGALTVGAAHFYEVMPVEPGRSPLASYQVGSGQMGPGPRRLERSYPPARQLVIRQGASQRVVATVRLFTDR